MRDRQSISRVSRRSFCQWAVAGVAGAGLASGPGVLAVAPQPASEGQAGQLRVIAYNILKCTGWPADRDLAKHAAEQGQVARRIALELALYDPHIVNFSESPDEKLTQEIAEQLGMHHVRFPSGEAWPGTLLSKFEIAESQNAPVVTGARPDDLFTRHWGRAVLRLPSGQLLVVHSAHLYPGKDPAIRLREVAAMLASMRSDLDAGRDMILMGDLNHVPESREYALWQEAGFVDTWAAVGDPHAATNAGGRTVPADTPRVRIDYVWAAGPLAQRIIASRPLWVGAFRTNPADAQSFALSDHVPQYAALAFAD